MKMIKTAKSIVQKLQSHGYTAYFAGGYVRDMLLGRESKDVDIVTSAEPNEIEKLFTETIPVGKAYGIIVVVEDDQNFEIATFRAESDYIDNRRPSKITFSSAENDALRRDFTINGLFYDPTANKLIDFVGGEEDIKKKTIRFIGNPEERIKEDHLRLVRAIRFKITLGFQYSKETFEAVRKLAPLIKDVSAERIRDELNKIMESPNRAQGLVELSESGLLKYIIPELDKLKEVPQPFAYHKEGDVFVHTYLALKSLEPNASQHLVWAVLLHDIAKPQTICKKSEKIIFHDHAQISARLAKNILKRLKFPNFEIYDIFWLIENHMKIGDIKKMRPAKAQAFVLDPKFNDLIKLARADSMGTYPVNLEIVKKLETYVKKAMGFKKEKEHIKKEGIINGQDLIEIGYIPGKIFSNILEDVHDQIIKRKINTKKDAIDYILKKYPL